MGPFLGSGLIGDLTTFSAAGYVVSWMLTAFCLIKLRRSEPGLKRPYTIPGGAKTAWFAGLCMAVLLVLLLMPGQPVWIGKLATVLFLCWMAIGGVLYVLDSRQRARYSKLKRASILFAGMAVADGMPMPETMEIYDESYKILSFIVPDEFVGLVRGLIHEVAAEQPHAGKGPGGELVAVLLHPQWPVCAQDRAGYGDNDAARRPHGYGSRRPHICHGSRTPYKEILR